MFQSTTQVRVRYAETDQMGVVYHANYLVWMEVGRVELCRSRGVIYSEMEQKDDILLAVTDVSCRYLSPARYDEEVTVTTTIAHASARRITFTYEMFCGKRRLSTGETRHIFLNREMRPARLPAKYFEMFGVSVPDHSTT